MFTRHSKSNLEGVLDVLSNPHIYRTIDNAVAIRASDRHVVIRDLNNGYVIITNYDLTHDEIVFLLGNQKK